MHAPNDLVRRLLDEPAGVPDDQRLHVAHCPQCLDRLTAMQQAGPTDAAGPTGATPGMVGRVAPHRSGRSGGLRRGPAAAVAVAVA